MVSGHLKTKEREARSSKDNAEQGEWWEAEVGCGAGEDPSGHPGSHPWFQASRQVPLGKDALTSDSSLTPHPKKKAEDPLRTKQNPRTNHYIKMVTQ